MDSLMLRDEAARDRVRQALEFLDPSMLCFCFCFSRLSACRPRRSLTNMSARRPECAQLPAGHYLDAPEKPAQTCR